VARGACTRPEGHAGFPRPVSLEHVTRQRRVSALCPRGNGISTLTLLRPPLTHPFRSCLPTRDSTPAVFRPCRFSRLRRLSPRTAFQHFSAGNASGVATLQSILPYPQSRTGTHAAVFPLRTRIPPFRVDCTDSPLFHKSELGAHSERGLSATPRRKLFPPASALAIAGALSSLGLRVEG